MKLYHGSNIVVDQPEIAKGKPYKDFGSLRVKRFETYTEEWAEFVLHNRDRKMPQPIHDFDIVYGPIADDGVVRQMRRYELGDITLPELMKELQYPPKITFQYFFGSEKALERLRFIC